MMPDGWRDVNLADVTSLIRNGFSCNQDKNGLGSPVTRIETISDGTINYERVGFTNAPIDNSYRLKSGDILFSHINSVKHIGKVAIYDDTYPLYHGMNLMLIRCQKSCASPLYIYYILSDRRAKAYFENHCKQAINQASLNRGDIGQFQFTLPPQHEQKKIAAILSSVDDAIQATQAVIDQTRTVKQGLMQQLLTRGIGHTRFKQTEIGEIPEEWDLVHLSEIASHERSSFTNGPFGSNLLKSDLRTEGVPVIYIRDIKTAIYNPVKQVYVDKDKANELSSCEVLPGDILITKVGDPPGIASIYPEGCEPAIVTQDVIRLRTNRKKCQPEFVRIVINSPLGGTLIDHISIDGTRKRMALGTFKKIPFPLPTLPEQEQITKAITLNENAIIEEQRKLNCFQDIKRGLMQDLLTGRVRVKLDEVNTT